MAMARTELAFASFEEGIDLELLALEEEQELISLLGWSQFLHMIFKFIPSAVVKPTKIVTDSK